MRSRTFLRLLAGIGITIMSGSCGPSYSTPQVTAQLARSSRSTVAELQRGHDVHQAKCAKCHEFQNPAAYDATELRREIMPAMARKAKLEAADEEAVTAYLLAVRNARPQP